jgi:aminoglycoside 6'-N-acetyltransferase
MSGRDHEVLTFRPIGRQDFALLSQWMSSPHVHTWWREDPDAAAVEARYGPAVDGTDATEAFIVESDGRPIGFIQRYLLADNPEWEKSLAATSCPDNGAGIDYFIGLEALIGQGVGPEIIERFAQDTFRRYPDVPAIVVDVDQDNRRSWRALEKAGFRRIWSGNLVSDDPSDAGPNHVYVRPRAEG